MAHYKRWEGQVEVAELVGRVMDLWERVMDLWGEEIYLWRGIGELFVSPKATTTTFHVKG